MKIVNINKKIYNIVKTIKKWVIANLSGSFLKGIMSPLAVNKKRLNNHITEKQITHFEDWGHNLVLTNNIFWIRITHFFLLY